MTENKNTSEAHKEESTENNTTTEAPKVDEKETQTNEIDYKAEYEKVVDQKDKAEFVIEKTKTENKELKQKIEETKEEKPDNNLDEIVSRLDKKFEERQKSFEAKQKESYIDESIAKLTNNPDKASLIKHHYENSINRTGFDQESINSDLTNALLIADRKKILSNNAELAEALKSKVTMGTSPEISSHMKETPSQERTVSDADQKVLNNLNARRAKRGLKPLTSEDVINN